MRWKFLPLLVASLAFAESQPQKLSISDFSGGLNSNYSGLTIADNEVQDSLNVYFDGTTPIKKREGYTICGSTDAVSMDSSWSYSDAGNNGWIIIRKPTRIVASNQGCSFTIAIATVSATDTVNAVNAFGNIWFVDRTQGLYTWNGTSTTYVSSAPHGSLIAEFRGRLWVSGLAHPYGNQLYSSGYLSGLDWSLGSLTTSAVLLTFGLNDSYDNITSLFSGYNDSMQVFKNLSIYGLYGFDQADFEARILNREVGCIDNRSLQPFLGGLVFASRRGVEYFDGVNVQTPPISDKVGNLVNNNGTSTFSELSWTQTSQADFQTGISTPASNISYGVSPGDVIVSSFQAIENSSTTWGTGTAISLAVGVSSLTLQMNNSGTITDPSFESTLSNNFVVGTGWVNKSAQAVTGCTISPSAGSSFAYIEHEASTTDAAINIVDVNSGVVLSTKTLTHTSGCTGWASSSVSASGLVGKRVKFRFCDYNSGSARNCIQTLSSYILGGDLTFDWRTDNYPGGLGIINTLSFDNVSAGSSTITSGSFISKIYDTGMSGPIIRADLSWTVSTSTPTFALLTSNSSGGPWTTLSVSTGINIQSRQYVRYTSTISIAGGNYDAITYISSATLIARSSGTYYSAVHNDSSLTSFSYLSVSKQDNGGTQTFYMRSSSNPFTTVSSTPAWQSQGPNTTISISTAIYFQLRDDFFINAATQTPTLSEFSISWRDGTPRSPMASVVAGKRYFLAFSTSTALNRNTSILMLTKGPVWSLWDVKAGSLLSHRGAYYATNNSDNGKVYTLFSGTSDDGTAIDSFVRTKDFTIGDITMDKLFDSFYLIFDSNGLSKNVRTTYFLDRQTGEYSLASISQDEATGIVTGKLNFPLSSTTPNFGKTLSLKFRANDLDDSLELYGGILNFRTRMTQ